MAGVGNRGGCGCYSDVGLAFRVAGVALRMCAASSGRARRWIRVAGVGGRARQLDFVALRNNCGRCRECTDLWMCAPGGHVAERSGALHDGVRREAQWEATNSSVAPLEYGIYEDLNLEWEAQKDFSMKENLRRSFTSVLIGVYKQTEI